MSWEKEWLDNFRKVIVEYHKDRAPDPFMFWFRKKNAESFFADDFEKLLTILIDARFDQRTTAENALQNTQKVVELGALKRKSISAKELDYIIPRQHLTGETWAYLFRVSLPKLHELAKRIVSEESWDAQELLKLMLHDYKVPYMGVKTSRLAIRWLYELMPQLKIDMRSYTIPVDTLVYRVSCRLGIINPYYDRYSGENSPADVKIQSFAKSIFPNEPHLLDEPLWATGRQADKGGYCFSTNTDCQKCLFNSICKRKFRNVDPSKIGMYT